CEICRRVFDIDVRRELPRRALPIAAMPPANIEAIFQEEVEAIKQLLKPGNRRKLDASARLRSLAIVEAAYAGEEPDVTPRAMKKLGDFVSKSNSWDDVFGSVPTIEVTADGSGVPVELK